MSQQSHAEPKNPVPPNYPEPLLSDDDHAADMQQWKDEQLTARIERNQDQDDE
jgi:hypothetical protein